MSPNSPSIAAPTHQSGEAASMVLSRPGHSGSLSVAVKGSESTSCRSGQTWSVFSPRTKFDPDMVQKIGRHWTTVRPGREVVLSLDILPFESSHPARSDLDLASWNHSELLEEIDTVVEASKTAQGKQSSAESKLSVGAAKLDVASDTSKRSDSDGQLWILKLKSLQKLLGGQGKPSLVIAPMGSDSVNIRRTVEAMKNELLKPRVEGTTPGICTHNFLGHTTDRLLEELAKCDKYIATMEEQLRGFQDVVKDKGKSPGDSTISQGVVAISPEDLKAEIKRATAEQERMKLLIGTLNETFREYAQK